MSLFIVAAPSYPDLPVVLVAGPSVTSLVVSGPVSDILS